MRVVRQFHFHGWPEIGIPAEGKGMIDLIAAVQKQQQQTGNHPITVHCRQEQYEFCYKVVQDFIDIFSDYANFK
ncbi:hypothetical protein MG293_019284 [Ovis ammon polii]|uniref:Tyrosine-protein phosphatase domain-containing protein n=1 Tax=Ovis ammon polii TaxID=230172 RepID=A0AAD4XY56_OVIAM|nr:hypothetical protein MG293_019284 [Ovis ammon polii]